MKGIEALMERMKAIFPAAPAPNAIQVNKNTWDAMKAATKPSTPTDTFIGTHIYINDTLPDGEYVEGFATARGFMPK